MAEPIPTALVEAGAPPHYWTGDDLARSGAHLVHLDPGECDRYVRDLPELPEDPDDEAFRRRAHDVVGSLARDVVERTQRGPGLAVVTGERLAAMPDERLRALLYAVSVVLGRPMPQNPAGDRIVSVRDEQAGDPEARGYRTNQRLPLHTDAADVAGLLCLSQGTGGGTNVFASAGAVHDALVEEAPELIAEYYRAWQWDLGGQQRPGADPTLSSPIFSSYRGRLSCRYASRLLRAAPARLGRTLSALEVETLDRFEQVAHRPSLLLRYRLRRGESMWINNYAVLHGREEFADGTGGGDARHLLRTWVWLHAGPELAPAFTSPRAVY